MIHVRLYAGICSRSYPGQKELHVPARSGLTAADVIREADVSPEDVRIVIVNGHSAGYDTVLTDGDRMALFPLVVGG